MATDRDIPEEYREPMSWMACIKEHPLPPSGEERIPVGTLLPPPTDWRSDEFQRFFFNAQWNGKTYWLYEKYFRAALPPTQHRELDIQRRFRSAQKAWITETQDAT